MKLKTKKNKKKSYKGGNEQVKVASVSLIGTFKLAMKEFNELLSAGKARVTKEMSKKGVGPNLLKELRALGLGSESESAIAEKIKKGQECISKTSTEAEAADKVDEIASGEGTPPAADAAASGEGTPPAADAAASGGANYNKTRKKTRGRKRRYKR
jgi:hypothetical protein